MTRSETFSSPLVGACAALALAGAFAAVRLAELPDRWVVAVMAGSLVLPAIFATGRPRRAALCLFVLSVQIGLTFYVTEPPAAPSAGVSWPNSLALPLSSLAALLALVFVNGRPFIWGGALSLSAGLLGLTTAISVAGSPVRWIGFSHFVLLCACWVIFLAAANAVRDRRDLEIVERLLLASLVLQCLIYLAQSVVGATFTPAGDWIDQSEEPLGRYGGLIGTRPAAFASFLLPLLLLSVTRFLNRAGGAGWRDGVLATLGGATLALTFTRASWIGFGLGLIYLITAGLRRGMLARWRIAVLLAVLLGVGVALAPKIWVRASEDHSAAFAERWALVEMALRVIRANPVAGVGAGAYPYVFRDYLTPDLADRWLFVVHNVYVLRAAETGLPGLAALLLFLCVAFRRASPGRMADPTARRLALAWRAGLVALSWEMLWDISLGSPANALLWFFCGLMTAASRLPEAKTR